MPLLLSENRSKMPFREGAVGLKDKSSLISDTMKDATKPVTYHLNEEVLWRRHKVTLSALPADRGKDRSDPMGPHAI